MSSNPRYIGPGYWASWHLKAMKSNTRSKKAEVSRNIVLDVSNFPCVECREDSIQYIKRNPLLYSVKSNDPLSLFKWTVSFHNHVNAKLDKQVFNWREALEMWQEETMCFENCGVPEETIVKEEEKPSEDILKFNLKDY